MNLLCYTYVSGGTVTFDGVTHNVTGATYDHLNGIITITTATPHGAVASDIITVANITWNCSLGNKVYPEIRSWFKDRKDGMYFNPQLSSLPLLDDKGKGYKLEVGETPEDCLNDFIKSVESGEMKSQLDDFDKRREKRNENLGEGRKKGGENKNR